MKKMILTVAAFALSGLGGCIVVPGYGFHHRAYIAGPPVFVGVAPVYPRYGYWGGGYRGGYCR